jgi:poly(3-hydroxybutyrate) depolymerase
MRSLFALTLVFLVATASSPSKAQSPKTPVATPLVPQDRDDLQSRVKQLVQAIDQLPVPAADRADAAIYAKGLEWGLRYDREFTVADRKLLQQAFARGEQRVQSLAADQSPWKSRRGKTTLGYISAVDGSVQPYGIIVPRGYDPTKPIRLDVVLHGSTRPVGMSELRFMARFDEGDAANENASDQAFIELHPLGRVENCYRWAGETDVFEAIADVQRRYRIDPDQIVLRGMSMGASGTWHLGLKHPDRFVALGPYCGYVDTHRFSETPLASFVRVGPLPEHQERTLHMLDSVDYAANAAMVPAIACMGEKDVFFQAHVIMGEAMRREGLEMVNLISPGTGHTIDPITHAEQMRRIAERVAVGINRHPANLRFVTWTLKYPSCHWLSLLGLERHYERAEFSARLNGEVLEIAEPKNITRFAIAIGQLPSRPRLLRIGTQELPLANGHATSESIFAKVGERWQLVDVANKVTLHVKRPGVQGPIDDAFTTPFLCVRGTGRPWNAMVDSYAQAALRRFADEWQQYFRGELPVKDDTAVTDEDVRTRNLILFGDPGSNRWIAQALDKLSIHWNRDELRFGDTTYAASTHLPALITASPLSGAVDRYLVLNTGHTFREAELNKLNYLLFPRWGDWAVLNIEPRGDKTQTLEAVVRAGLFNESWRIPQR